MTPTCIVAVLTQGSVQVRFRRSSNSRAIYKTMPAAITADSLPKPCKDLLVKLGNNPTVETYAGIEPILRKKAFSAMNSHLKGKNPEGLKKYKECSTVAQQQRFMCAFLVDPVACDVELIQTKTRETSNEDSELVEWVTLAELGGPAYMNSIANAELAINDLTPRDHELASLAAADIKQYELSKTTKRFLMNKNR